MFILYQRFLPDHIDSSYKADLLILSIYQLNNMTPQDVVLIVLCLMLAPTILTTLHFVDESPFTFVAAIRQQFSHYLADQGGVSETSGRTWRSTLPWSRDYSTHHSPLPPTPSGDMLSTLH